MKAEITDIANRHPLTTLFASLLAVAAVAGFASGADLDGQLASTALSAAVSTAALVFAVPSIAKWRKPDVDAVRFALCIVAVGALAAVCTASVSLFSSSFGDGIVFSPPSARLLLVGALLCAATGLFEEALFRGIAVTCLYRHLRASAAEAAPAEPTCRFRLRGFVAGESSPIVSASLIGSLLFALMHVVGTPALSADGFAASAVAAIQVILKMIQAGMFGFCMAALMVKTRSIWLPVLAHALFDMLYFAPVLAAWGALPATHVTGNCGDLVVLVLSIAFLAPLCRKSRRWMMDEVLPYTSNPKSR